MFASSLCVAATLVLCLPACLGQSTPVFGNVRLVGVNGSTAVSFGRLEIYYNEEGSPSSPSRWGTVCWLGFEISDADVPCRELGFLYASGLGNVDNFASSFLGDRGSGPIWLSSVECSVDDTRLVDCSYSSSAFCQFSPVTVHCSNEPDPVRLVTQDGRTGVSTGRLDILVNNLWGTGCHDSFDSRTADVACRQLGFPGGAISRNSAEELGYESPDGVFWLSDIVCSSDTGANLRTCGRRRPAPQGCTHDKDVILSCLTEGSLRLVTSMSAKVFTPYGRLEIYLNGTWGTVCGDGFGPNSALVACRQLGFSHAGSFTSVVSQSEFPIAPDTQEILLDHVSCNGTEQNLLSCPRGNVSVTPDCSHAKDVVVYCGDFDASYVPPPKPCFDEGAIRITGQSPLVGFVEVCLERFWGTVCISPRRDSRVANPKVICRQLGRQLGVEIVESIYFGSQMGYDATRYSYPINIANPVCTGSEAALLDCGYERQPYYCSHDGDVSVACIPTESNWSLLPNCNVTDFQCGNRLCVDNSLVCDDQNDCWDWSDETVPGCFTLENRQSSLEEVKKRGLGLTLGLSIWLVAGTAVMWLAVLAVCMLVPLCPLRQIYSSKTTIPDPRVARVRGSPEGGGGGGRGGGGTETSGLQFETSAAPLVP